MFLPCFSVYSGVCYLSSGHFLSPCPSEFPLTKSPWSIGSWILIKTQCFSASELRVSEYVWHLFYHSLCVCKYCTSSSLCIHTRHACVCVCVLVYIFLCTCVCVLTQTERPPGVLGALLQPCSSLGICHGARINKQRWKTKKIRLLSSPVFLWKAGVYYHHQGKTLLNFTVLLVVCIYFMTHTPPPSHTHIYVQCVRHEIKCSRFVQLCRIVFSLNTHTHRW